MAAENLAAEGAEHGQTAGEYIVHHLTFWQNQKPGNVVDFSVFNWDSMLWAIAFVIHMDSGYSQITVAPYQGESSSPVASWIALTDGQSWDTAPQWSPDARVIYFTSSRDGFRCIWALHLDASHMPVGAPKSFRAFPILGLIVPLIASIKFSRPWKPLAIHLVGPSAIFACVRHLPG